MGVKFQHNKMELVVCMESLKRLPKKKREEDDKRVHILVKLGMIVTTAMRMLPLMMSFGLKEAYFLNCPT